jgi:hypothetical protein
LGVECPNIVLGRRETPTILFGVLLEQHVEEFSGFRLTPVGIHSCEPPDERLIVVAPQAVFPVCHGNFLIIALDGENFLPTDVFTREYFELVDSEYTQLEGACVRAGWFPRSVLLHRVIVAAAGVPAVSLPGIALLERRIPFAWQRVTLLPSLWGVAWPTFVIDVAVGTVAFLRTLMCFPLTIQRFEVAFSVRPPA